MKRLLLATTNRDKLREIEPLLARLPIELVRLGERDRIEPPEETGRTFAENARAKARFYAKATGLMAVAEDSGLEVDALGGQPGVQSARYGGDDLPYAQKFALIYEALAATGANEWPARFVCALALADGENILFEARGTIEGFIAPEPKGLGGFGYDPIFFYPPFRCTLAEAGARKAEVSHRAKAFRDLRRYLIRTLEAQTMSSSES